MGDRKVLVGFTDGNVDVWDVKGILTGTVSPLALSSLLRLLTEPSLYETERSRAHLQGSRFTYSELASQPVSGRWLAKLGLSPERFLFGRPGHRSGPQNPAQTRTAVYFWYEYSHLLFFHEGLTYLGLIQWPGLRRVNSSSSASQMGTLSSTRQKVKRKRRSLCRQPWLLMVDTRLCRLPGWRTTCS